MTSFQTMTPFQLCTLGILGVMLLWEIVRLLTGRALRRPALVRCLVWLAAGISIAKPKLLQSMATAVGIQRGTDLVVYLLALTFLATTFYMYSRYVRIQRQVVDLVRELAILQAGEKRPASPSSEKASPDRGA